MAIFTASYRKLIGIVVASLAGFTGHAQGTKGFSSQTQGSEVRFVDRVTAAALNQTIIAEKAATLPSKLRIAFRDAKQDSVDAHGETKGKFTTQRRFDRRRNKVYAKTKTARENVTKAIDEAAAVGAVGADSVKTATTNARAAVLAGRTSGAADSPDAIAIAAARTKGADAIPALLAAPALVGQDNPQPGVALAEVAIDDDITLLALYDDYQVTSKSRLGIGKWHVGIVSDGDFNKSLTDGTAPAPKSGSLGVDAVRMKPIYYDYTYTSEGVKELVGRKMVMVPSFVFNTLGILFAQSTPLSTGLVSGSTQTSTVTKAFGQTLLVPGSNAQGGLSFTVNASYFPFVLAGPKLGRIAVDVSLNLTQSRWESRSVISDVNIFAPMAGLSYKILDEHVQVGTANNNIQVQVFGRYTGRHLFGDIERHTGILTDAIGTTDRTYHGFDVGFTTSVNAIRFTVNIPMFGGNIDGFSSGQPVVGVGLAAAIRLN